MRFTRWSRLCGRMAKVQVLSVLGLSLFLAQSAQAKRVFLLRTGTSAQSVNADSAVKGFLESMGHTVTLSTNSSGGNVYWYDFSSTNKGGFDASQYDVVFTQMVGVGTVDMPRTGQELLKNFVETGGGLIMGGDTNRVAAMTATGQPEPTRLGLLATILPTTPSLATNSYTSKTFDRTGTTNGGTAVTYDPTIHDGLGTSFTFTSGALATGGSTEDKISTVKSGAKVFFKSVGASIALVNGTPTPIDLPSVVGWTENEWTGGNAGATLGRVLIFSTTITASGANAQLPGSGSPLTPFGQLFNNAIGWTTGELVPIPAALPAGLALLGLVMGGHYIRRRKAA